ncbi:hypothetical protein [Gracilibacillus saliphilus]|uniref:hypothetical protein n=1 Tax=Gracilibacillus saliphilus TaxID=543890 RepID=UPI0013CFA5F1|nr:hypothetical protein [Gracilibacillus saliphilus]
MNEYTKFLFAYHLFILLIASGIIFSYAMNQFQVAYVIFGGVIAIGSIYQLYQIVLKMKVTNEEI